MDLLIHHFRETGEDDLEDRLDEEAETTDQIGTHKTVGGKSMKDAEYNTAGKEAKSTGIFQIMSMSILFVQKLDMSEEKRKQLQQQPGDLQDGLLEGHKLSVQNFSNFDCAGLIKHQQLHTRNGKTSTSAPMRPSTCLHCSTLKKTERPHRLLVSTFL